MGAHSSYIKCVYKVLPLEEKFGFRFPALSPLPFWLYLLRAWPTYFFTCILWRVVAHNFQFRGSFTDSKMCFTKIAPADGGSCEYLLVQMGAVSGVLLRCWASLRYDRTGTCRDQIVLLEPLSFWILSWIQSAFCHLAILLSKSPKDCTFIYVHNMYIYTYTPFIYLFPTRTNDSPAFLSCRASWRTEIAQMSEQVVTTWASTTPTLPLNPPILQSLAWRSQFHLYAGNVECKKLNAMSDVFSLLAYFKND